ncbi:MAG TPA: hypothetical protein VHN99_07870 [Deinococcales bacterium]|nr:hypothetical protein [Deinococcales bacterium]
MARSNLSYFDLKLGNTKITAIGTVSGLKRSRSGALANEGTDASEPVPYVGATKHDNVQFTCTVISGDKGSAITDLEQMYSDHGKNDPDDTATYANGTVTLYADEKFKTRVGSYALNRCKVLELDYGSGDREDDTGKPWKLTVTLLVASGGWKDGNRTGGTGQ